MEWEVETTSRGFEIVEFKDRNGESGTLQQSSAAIYEQPGAGAVWLGPMGGRLHLDEEMVENLIAHLQAWLATGSFDLDAYHAEQLAKIRNATTRALRELWR